MKNPVSKLALGTAQLGFDYGINNQTGQPSRSESLAILDFAYEQGIRVFDTASAYGEAEEVLGEFISTRNLSSQVEIVSKLKPNAIGGATNNQYEIILDNLQQSLKRLKRDYVDGYLFHTPSYIRDEALVNCLVKLKAQGLVKNIGVSIYEPEDALYAANLAAVDYIQIPYSILDQRLDQTDFFQIAKHNQKTIFARSAFLQGLLLMPEEKIPPHLEKVKGYLRELDEIISRYGLSRQAAALLFSQQNENIDYVVLGVDNIPQLKEYTDLLEQKIDFSACRRELAAKFTNIEREIITPSLWGK